MGDEPNGERARLLDFLERNRDRTLAAWESAVRRIPSASRLDLDALRDHIPELIDGLIDALGGKPRPPLEVLANRHARARLDQGISLEIVAHEYRLLRAALFTLLQAEPAPVDPAQLLLLNETIDLAVGRALAHYHEARTRTLDALERVSHEAFASHAEGLREFLRRFLSAVTETFAPVDTTVLYLREWDRLVARAGAGLEATSEDRVSVRIGEGFVGRIALDHRPRFTASAADEPLVNPVLVQAGVKALYGAPLLDGRDLLGVATMGSRTAVDFSPEDRQLFRDMAQRAAILIEQRALAEERDVFLGVLSHDLRAPLNTILMGAAYLRGEALSEPATRATANLGFAARRIEKMIDGLTDYTKVRFGGGITVDAHVVDLDGTLRQLITELLGQHAGREIRFERRGDLVCECDAVRVGEVITNLVNNAVLYGDGTSPVVVVADGTAPSTIALSVTNKGAPIPPSIVPHLFDAFRRGRTTSSGMGLGLFIVRHIAIAHGGEVTVESKEDGETIFRVVLPRWRTPRPNA